MILGAWKVREKNNNNKSVCAARITQLKFEIDRIERRKKKMKKKKNKTSYYRSLY